MINTELNNLIMSAMKNGDKVRLNALKSIKTAIVGWTQSKENVGKTLDEATEINILRKLQSQYADASVQCNDGKHDELVKENADLANIIGEYLPTPISEEDIDNKVVELIASGIEPIKANMGKIIKAVKEHYPSADGKMVSSVVQKHIG